MKKGKTLLKEWQFSTFCISFKIQTSKRFYFLINMSKIDCKVVNFSTFLITFTENPVKTSKLFYVFDNFYWKSSEN